MSDIVEMLDGAARIEFAFAPEMIPHSLHSLAAREIERLQAIEKRYEELLGHVSTRIPNESRHETALRILSAWDLRPSAVAVAVDGGPE